MIIGNFVLPAFCTPTSWAIVVLLICTGGLITYPFIKEEQKWLPIISFVNGVTFCILVYCLLFIGRWNSLSIPLILVVGIGFSIVAPQFLLLQLLWKYIVKPVSGKARSFFLLGFIPCVLVTIYAAQSYKSAAIKLRETQAIGFEEIERGFMTEKILGMHFIYHTEICEYDGWRPPKHEPLLVIGMFFYGGDPLDIELEERMKIYKKVYPKNRIKFNCSCTWLGDERSYHNSPFFK